MSAGKAPDASSTTLTVAWKMRSRSVENWSSGGLRGFRQEKGGYDDRGVSAAEAYSEARLRKTTESGNPTISTSAEGLKSSPYLPRQCRLLLLLARPLPQLGLSARYLPRHLAPVLASVVH